MPNPRRAQAEQSLQQIFSKSNILSGLLIAGLVIGARYLISGLPDRVAQPDAVAVVTFKPVSLKVNGGPLRIAGAWQIESAERRLGGLSALAVDGEHLVAISDSGVMVRMPKRLAGR